MPMPPYPPPPFFPPGFNPRPPRRDRKYRRKPSSSDFSSDSDDDSCASSEDLKRFHGKKRKNCGHACFKTNKEHERVLKRQRQWQQNNRRESRRHTDRNDSWIIKPVLTYINRDGDIKLERGISEVDAAELMRHNPHSRDNINGAIRDGPKQIVFNPGENKKISNFAVSFQVSPK